MTTFTIIAHRLALASDHNHNHNNIKVEIEDHSSKIFWLV
jgi:hypothetical protein